jgi:hypothetical protein
MQLGKYLPDLVSFLSKFDSKRKGENIDTQIRCGDFSLAIVLIGKKAKVRRLGCEPYVNHIKRIADEGCKVIYIMAGGRRNCDVAQETIIQILKETMIKKTDEYRDIIEYEGGVTEVLCIRLENTVNPYDPCADYFVKNY